MDIESIKKIVKQVKKSRFDEFEMKNGEVSIKFSLDPVRNENEPAVRPAAVQAVNEEKPSAPKSVEDEMVRIIPAPIVGRFYSTMSTDSVKMVKTGDRVKKNQKICMIEAMNIEQEIGSPFSGILEEMLVDDGEAVMYGQPLFKIRLEPERA